VEKTIWTPRLYGRCDFGIYLDEDFAKEMIQSYISTERQNKMNELGNDELKIFEINWLNPYMFYKNSCFITQFYIGQDGAWLSTNHQSVDELIRGESYKPIQYNSHNIDTTKQAYVLMRLFDKWIEYSDVLKEN